jgi:hypothetical protein
MVVVNTAVDAALALTTTVGSSVLTVGWVVRVL